MRQLAFPRFELAAAAGAPVVQPLAASRWETLFVVVATIMLATSATEIFLTFGKPGLTYPIQVRLGFLAIYVVAGLLLLSSRDALPTLLRTSPVLAVVLTLPAVSMLWSDNPDETLERTIAVVGTSLFGVYLGWRFTLGRMVFLLAVAFSIALGLSLLAIVLMPSVGVAPSGALAGTWRGIHFHKNGLGGAAAIGSILIGYAIGDTRGATRLALCISLVVAIVLLIGSQSITSLLTVLSVGSIAIWLRLLQTRPREIPVLTLILVIGIVIATVQLVGMGFVESVLGALGKRVDLSSRVPLWEMVWTFIGDRFWLGYGFQAFWESDSTALEVIADHLYFTPFYSHNGLLETWLNGGLVLVVFVLALLAITIIRSAILFSRWRGLSVSAFPLIYCAHFIMINFTESTVLSRNNMYWALLVAIAVFTGKWVRLRVL